LSVTLPSDNIYMAAAESRPLPTGNLGRKASAETKAAVRRLY
jgi:hypothetical protein